VFEIEYAAIAVAAARGYREISRFPSIRRDIAVVLGEAVAYAEVEQRIRAAASGLLTHLQLFDVYKGKGIESGSKSLALGLTFQTLERTLSDGDVDSALHQILTALAQHFGAKLRS
ncbi:MAG: phenylalanine--tRNA ligase subunit beta, partial [Gammaproteobacteria bacterium]|nr:phenylalanine--tRNA ligase subunit beta [Gammaproteobacteria bacterium]